MSRLPSAARVAAVALLTVAWCALWGEVTVANVTSGIGLSALSVRFGAARSPGRSVHPIAMTQFLAVVAVDLVKSTYAVAKEVLTPTDRTDETIIAVDPGPGAVDHLMLLVVAITVTPGTAVVDTDPETGRLYLHLLHADSAPSVTLHIERISRLATAALPAAQDRHATRSAVVR